MTRSEIVAYLTFHGPQMRDEMMAGLSVTKKIVTLYVLAYKCFGPAEEALLTEAIRDREMFIAQNEAVDDTTHPEK